VSGLFSKNLQIVSVSDAILMSTSVFSVQHISQVTAHCIVCFRDGENHFIRSTA